MEQIAYFSDTKKTPPKRTIDEEEFERRKNELKKMMGES